MPAWLSNLLKRRMEKRSAICNANSNIMGLHSNVVPPLCLKVNFYITTIFVMNMKHAVKDRAVMVFVVISLVLLEI